MMAFSNRPLLTLSLLALLFTGAAVAFVGTGPPSAEDALAREIFEELIEINTTDSVGDNTKAAEAMARRLRDAGFSEEDVRVCAGALELELIVYGHAARNCAAPRIRPRLPPTVTFLDAVGPATIWTNRSH